MLSYTNLFFKIALPIICSSILMYDLQANENSSLGLNEQKSNYYVIHLRHEKLETSSRHLSIEVLGDKAKIKACCGIDIREKSLDILNLDFHKIYYKEWFPCSQIDDTITVFLQNECNPIAYVLSFSDDSINPSKASLKRCKIKNGKLITDEKWLGINEPIFLPYSCFIMPQTSYY